MFKRYTLISGNNGQGDKTPELKQQLKHLGYNSNDCQGKYQGKTENSLLVPGLPQPVAQALAKRYGQESYIQVQDDQAELIFTENGTVLRSKGFIKFDCQPEDDYTLVKATGQCFTFEFDWS